ncbi:hypothetical protein [Oceanicoccus sagamiensis]|uniref:Scaffold protein FimL second domain-containing protein n=1 Tax=Oceanicoccus sagamiensis TaxID=716816 RepID=A0A1X9NFA4_9GAMM|nr:hypothetical protein [Oceanicoccus sagamiensis]ARN75851.1 hypothetical protein BST96_18125 [Oceanicoccus sagamiensis]
MSLDVSINLNSLRVIQEELGSTLSQAANEFEAYTIDQSNSGHINACHECLVQVGGTFRLLEYPGAALLADEMALLVSVMADEERKTTNTMIEALTHALFVLPRYIEYISVRQSELPILVIPYVNELRVSRRAELMAESHFYQGEIPTMGLMAAAGSEPDLRLLKATAPRLRHMYQTGLVGVIKEPDSSPHYLFMSRAVARFVALLGNHSQAEIWQLASAVLEAFGAGKLEMTLNRKRNLADIEKLMRLVVSQGDEGLAQAPPASLKQDLLFMLMLSSYSSDAMSAMRQAYSLPSLAISDDDIAKQRASMHGPSLDTIESVIKVLSEELRNAKDVLEIGSQNNSIDGEDLSLLIDTVARVADTLSVLNLQGPKDTLTEQLEIVRAWQSDASDVGSADFISVADTLLYIESALGGLDRRELTVEDLNQATAITRKKIIASSQLAQAEQLVIEEAQSGIALAKRAITSYVDSNFDVAHISNVTTTLNTVRGGLHMLNYNRAAAVLKSCHDFVEHHIAERNPGEQRHQLLETLADALISLEYYLTELETSRSVNEDILLVAEESLAALGFAVETAE